MDKKHKYGNYLVLGIKSSNFSSSSSASILLSKISFFAKSVIVAIAALLSRNPLALSSS